MTMMMMIIISIIIITIVIMIITVINIDELWHITVLYRSIISL